MSRIGKKPILIPAQTEVTVTNGLVSVKGPKGASSRLFKADITIEVKDGVVILEPKRLTLANRALWGTYASHIDNMILGVNTPFEKKLVVEGVGFRAEVRGKELVLELGFSHTVTILIPEGLTVTAEKNVLTINGIDKELVGSFSAKIRTLKKPEPYKGKGIRYSDEVIRRKQGKKSV